jgi:hypothetical protein
VKHADYFARRKAATAASSLTEEELTELEAAIERQREADDVPHELPAPLADHRYRGNWSKTKAITPVVYGHVRLGTARFPTRLEMIVALNKLDAEEAA